MAVVEKTEGEGDEGVGVCIGSLPVILFVLGCAHVCSRTYCVCVCEGGSVFRESLIVY